MIREQTNPKRVQLIRVLFHGVCILLIALSILIVVTAQRAIGADRELTARAERNARLEQLAQDLEEKRLVLEEREQSLAAQEERLKNQEKDLDKKIDELKSIRQALDASFEAQRKNGEEKVSKLVTVFESMQPKAAAQVLETVEDWLAVDVLRKMEVKKMAKLMNIMDKQRSARLSEMMTGHFKPAAMKSDSSESRVPASVDAPKSVEEKNAPKKQNDQKASLPNKSDGVVSK